MAYINDWVAERIYKISPGHPRDHPNYPAWIAALEEMGRAHGYNRKPLAGTTPGYCAELVEIGVDPEQIKTTFTLIFL